MGISSDLYNPTNPFIETLDISPHIASYVHGLTLPCNWIRQRPSPSWMDTDTAISQLLPRLLLTLADHKPKPWSTFSWSFREAIAVVLANRCLLEIDLTGVGCFPSELLRHCPTVTRLSLASLFRTENTPNDGTSQNRLSCPTSIPELSEIMPYLRCLRIQTGDLPVHDSYNSLGYILSRYGAATPDLQKFMTLQSLTIDAKFTVRIFHHRSLIDYFTSPLPWITDLLKTISSSSWPAAETLTRLTLNLSLELPFPNELIRLIDKALENLIIDLSSRFPNLKTVELRIVHLDGEGFGLLSRGKAGASCVERGWSMVLIQ
ncbi:hypothetical protein CPB84DRAFT_1795116 [Gymnopilus junonius]|uniref:Uncharacterized protein n=1 Tax=Gymnopilus junonius TaxID=109634 RepID=A0A9P5NCX9_GYMJU|nr:hypothetical protein CPB84DRAFT_1795116 [Gymnopilus junonius]